MSDNNSSLLKRMGMACLRSPIHTLFAIATLGCLGYIFILGNADFFYKMVLVGIVLLWLFWVIAKYVLAFLLILGMLGVGGYFYYNYSRQDMLACEQSGGYWNKNTKTCEEKRTFVQQLESMWNAYMNKDKKANVKK